MTSLVGRELQYVIAEATQTLSLQDDTIHEKADGLWKGETILPRRDGPCSVAMDLFTGVLEGKGDYLVVSDLSTDDRFSHINLAEGSPRMKFFAAVPLVSVKGLVVGAFYIVDDTPRERLFNAQLAFMKDVASTIMAHLEAGRVKQQHKRAERMIRGLGLYVEGKSSLREWWLNTGHKADELEVTEKARQGESLNQQADQEFGVQDVPDDLATAAIASVPSSYHKGYPLSSDGFQAAIGNVSRRRTPQYSPDGRTDITDDSALLSTSPESVFTKQPGASNSTLTGNTRTSSKAPLRHTPQDNQHPTNDPLGDTSGARLQEAVLSDELKESLSRASNLIRESIAVDGALFLDASVGTFGGSSTKADIGFIGPTARNDDGTLLTTSSSDEARQRFVSIQQQSRPCANLRSGGMAQGYSGKACGVLGYSTSTRSSLNMHEPSQLHSGVKEEFLRKLLRRYPHGKVFNFRDNGSLSSSEDEIQNASQTGTGMTSKERQGVGKDSVRRRGKKKASREAEAREILRFLPSARCVAFFPLWDSHKERWFAGSFVWATDPTRVLDPDEDLTYLASFGNSIMAEVSRLSALMSSQLKDSFVSSISHELRSPLHGVLASVEFLQDSPLNTFQQEMVSNIGSCGKALLDTLDHVLEFTKLRRAVTDKAQDSNPRSGPKRTRSGPSSPLPTRSNAPVDLRILTEEVLQGLYTGSAFEKRQSISDRQSLSLVPDSSLSATRPVPPMIIADLFWQENWSFEIDPGAWRRLVMNIFGNSLKYTDTGFVRVALRSSDAKESSSDDTSSSTVTLTILDSGKGISKEFSGHHLYTPFAQEDSLAVGSGLGMSIVRHIVDELEGTISVESEQGFGTDVSISLPLTQAKASVVHGNETDLISQVRDQMHGLRMCLVGFEVLPDLVDEPTGILSVAARGKLYLKDSLVTLLNDWFGVEAAVEATLNPAPGAVSFIMEPVFNKLLSAGLPAVKVDTAPYRKSVVFVLCSKQCDVCPAIVHSAFEVVYVQQP